MSIPAFHLTWPRFHLTAWRLRPAPLPDSGTFNVHSKACPGPEVTALTLLTRVRPCGLRGDGEVGQD